jgi:type II secretory pathway pseudopilin PulG
MDRRQRALLIESVIVLIATAAAVVGMVQLKDYVNRSEAMRAMTQLGQRILEYRKQYGSLPPQSFVDSAKGDVEGSVRMGNVNYRALWIGLDAPSDTILAYSQKHLPSSFLKDGYVVLRLDGVVEWMPTDQFVTLFARQRTPAEPGLSKE